MAAKQVVGRPGRTHVTIIQSDSTSEVPQTADRESIADAPKRQPTTPTTPRIAKQKTPEPKTTENAVEEYKSTPLSAISQQQSIATPRTAKPKAPEPKTTKHSVEEGVSKSFSAPSQQLQPSTPALHLPMLTKQPLQPCIWTPKTGKYKSYCNSNISERSPRKDQQTSPKRTPSRRHIKSRCSGSPIKRGQTPRRRPALASLVSRSKFCLDY